MKLLLKQITVSDKYSPYNGLTKDILIINGSIERIDDNINETDATVINIKGAVVSQGWVDIFAHFNDPGIEYKETLETGADAAAAGGFTHVFVVPNTKPVAYNKATVEYIVQKAKTLPVNIYPLGAVTKEAEGKELSEMYDMRASGAIAFSDGLQPIQTPGLLLKALQYVKAFDGTIIQMPVDKSISKFGLMNEGIVSTRLGLPGLPAIAEELIVTRDIELAKYTNSKLHITGITTGKSLQLIKAAKAEGVPVTCSVTPYHLTLCDEDLLTYDTNLKVDPPLRSREDMMALRVGIIDGTIDCIATHHQPQNWDNKVCEFEYAKPGMIGLETAYAVINTAFPSLDTTRLVELFSTNARNIFALPNNIIKEGAVADLTIFSPATEVVFDAKGFKSKSNNSPFTGKQLTGKPIGIVNKDKVYLSQTVQNG